MQAIKPAADHLFVAARQACSVSCASKGVATRQKTDLRRELDAATDRRKSHWHWDKGHARQKDNERCDELANQTIDR